MGHVANDTLMALGAESGIQCSPAEAQMSTVLADVAAGKETLVRLFGMLIR
jgi:hypothetical protein